MLASTNVKLLCAPQWASCVGETCFSQKKNNIIAAVIVLTFFIRCWCDEGDDEPAEQALPLALATAKPDATRPNVFTVWSPGAEQPLMLTAVDKAERELWLDGLAQFIGSALSQQRIGDREVTCQCVVCVCVAKV